MRPQGWLEVADKRPGGRVCEFIGTEQGQNASPMTPERLDDIPTRLLQRLDAIAQSLQHRGDALALIGLGSAGRERERLDAFSDLDFFVVARPGRKGRHLADLDWLAAARPLEWQLRNTRDGYKAMMDDGILCEFAVFEPDELREATFAAGRIVWCVDGFDAALAQPRAAPAASAPATEEWLVGEALSCLYVGLQRWRRGEKLSAARFVQGYALDRLVELATRTVVRQEGIDADPFNAERRLETRLPQLAGELPALVPGYARTPAAALALLDALAGRSALAAGPMADRVRSLARAALEE